MPDKIMETRYMVLILYRPDSEYAYTACACDSMEECEKIARKVRRVRALVEGGRMEPDEEIELPDGNIVWSGDVESARIFTAEV